MGIGGLFVNANFETMTLRELKQHVLEHRDDGVAFQALMDRIDAQPQSQVYGEVEVEQFAALLRQHQNAQNI